MRKLHHATLFMASLLAINAMAGEREFPRWQRHMEPLIVPKAAKHPALSLTPDIKTSAASTPTVIAPAQPIARFIGSLMQNGQLFIFVEFNGQVHSLKEGEELPGAFQVMSANENEARIQSVASHESRVIRLD